MPDNVDAFVQDFITNVACPGCIQWLRQDSVAILLGLADGNAREVYNCLSAIHELVCMGFLTPEEGGCGILN